MKLYFKRVTETLTTIKDIQINVHKITYFLKTIAFNYLLSRILLIFESLVAKMWINVSQSFDKHVSERNYISGVLLSFIVFFFLCSSFFNHS